LIRREHGPHARAPLPPCAPLFRSRAADAPRGRASTRLLGARARRGAARRLRLGPDLPRRVGRRLARPGRRRCEAHLVGCQVGHGQQLALGLEPVLLGRALGAAPRYPELVGLHANAVFVALEGVTLHADLLSFVVCSAADTELGGRYKFRAVLASWPSARPAIAPVMLLSGAVAEFTCQECGRDFAIPEATLARYPNWAPKRCLRCKTQAGTEPAGRARRTAPGKPGGGAVARG